MTKSLNSIIVKQILHTARDAYCIKGYYVASRFSLKKFVEIAYRARKKQSLRMDEVCNDINSLKEDLAEIKSALQVILKNR